MDLNLAGRVYLVTGGSTGLGFATASALVDEGANVVIAARSADRVDAAVARLGPHAIGHVADLADPAAPQVLIDRARAHFGRLDGALVSVGGPPAGSVLSVSDDQWRSAFESVFLGSVRMARAVARDLLTAGSDGAGPAGAVTDGAGTDGTVTDGAIVLVLSTSAVEVFPGLSTSNGLRPGLAMLVTDLADEVGPSGLRVLGLLPGRIATDRMTGLDAATGDPAAAVARACASIPLRRYGTPAEFGCVAAFALSPAAGYLTGSVIRVDGGATRNP